MYQVGDYVVKMNAGICHIEDIVHMDEVSGNKDKLYYLLVPLSDGKMKIYVPTDHGDSVLRKALTSQEAWDVIGNISQIQAADIENEKLREQEYKEAIRSCRPESWVSIIKTMYQRKEKRFAQGKKEGAMDERYFHMAEEYLYTELAFAIGRKKGEMCQLIADTIEKSGKEEK